MTFNAPTVALGEHISTNLGVLCRDAEIYESLCHKRNYHFPRNVRSGLISTHSFLPYVYLIIAL
jgi:hypothetical protein